MGNVNIKTQKVSKYLEETMDISTQLKRIRQEMGKTQKELASELGLPQQTWANYETGRSEPAMEIIFKLSEMGYTIHGFDGSAGEAIRETAKKTGLSEEEVKRQAIEHLHKLAETYPSDTPIDELPKPEYTKPSQPFDVFRLRHGTGVTVQARETDLDALVLLPVFSQTASAGPGQTETQLQEIDKYIPIVLDMLGGASPSHCGIVRVVGDSMTDMNLFNGDFAIFDRTQTEGDGVYVISISGDVRVKHIEYRPIERKIVISSDNAKRYPNPEIITYEQAENLLRIHGKVISWLHKNPY